MPEGGLVRRSVSVEQVVTAHLDTLNFSARKTDIRIDIALGSVIVHATHTLNDEYGTDIALDASAALAVGIIADIEKRPGHIRSTHLVAEAGGTSTVKVTFGLTRTSYAKLPPHEEALDVTLEFPAGEVTTVSEAQDEAKRRLAELLRQAVGECEQTARDAFADQNPILLHNTAWVRLAKARLGI